MGDESASGNVLRRRRKGLSESEEAELPGRWREVVRSYEGMNQPGSCTAYPRRQRLFEILREDGRIRLMLEYDHENPAPDFRDYGQRRQVESILGFEEQVGTLIAEAESRWSAGNYEGEAALLEEFANSNPQRDAILGLAAEARRDALTGGSSRTKPRRRDLS